MEAAAATRSLRQQHSVQQRHPARQVQRKARQRRVPDSEPGRQRSRNIYENNILYAGTPISGSTATHHFQRRIPPTATLNWHLYNSSAGYLEGTSILWGGVDTFTSFSNWQTASGEDADSLNTDPLLSVWEQRRQTLTHSSSPAVGAGGTSLLCSDGWCDPNGSSPNSIYAAPTSSGIRGQRART